MNGELAELQVWYASQCDGDWEHQDGVDISTLDNPGWSLVINLTGSALEGHSFDAVEENYEHDTDWLRCWVADGRFQGAGGPLKLTRMLRIFLDWARTAESHSPGAPAKRVSSAAFMTTEQLVAEFANRGLAYSGGLLLLTSGDALSLVGRARAERVPILGVEGMFVRPHETVSPLEYIADYSTAVARGDGSWDDAERFIAEHAQLDLAYEVVLGVFGAPAV